MKIKFNWGTGIIISFIIFMSASAGTAIFFMNQDVDLVSDNYYEKEIRYQHQIESKKLTELKKAGIGIEYITGSIVLRFPLEFISSGIHGKIHVYRPSDSIQDIFIPVLPDDKGIQKVSSENMHKGMWTIKVDWTSGSDKFYSEKNVMVY